MSSYFITGKLGSGKTLIAVGRMFDYLSQGRVVATNINLKLENYLNLTSKKTYIRVPDKPSLSDLEMLGFGNSTPNEEKNGLLVLDELGSWFNSRNWQDKSRQSLLEWFIHARKYGWDLLLIVQDISMVDAQLRGMLGEHLVICKRLDRLKIPFIGGFLRMFGMKGLLPKIHMARVHYGESVTDLLVDRWVYRGNHFYDCYDTKQVFSPSYSSGLYSSLSPNHLVGRYLPPALSFNEKLSRLLFYVPSRPVLKPKLPLVARIAQHPDPAARVFLFRRMQDCGHL